MFAKRPTALAIMGTAAMAIAFTAPAQGSQADDTTLAPLSMAKADGIEGTYNVILKKDSAFSLSSTKGAEIMEAKVTSTAKSVRNNGGTVVDEYAGIGGFTAELDSKQLEELRKDPRVESISQDAEVTVAATPWGLDRTDQRDLPLDGQYTGGGGEGVTAYIIDTGINSRHTDFTGRIKPGIDTIDGDTNPEDCNGHGTHVAGSVAGTKYGIAPEADIVGVRVLNCQGSGSYAAIIGGMDWVAQNHSGPSVANLSLGGGADSSVDTALNRMVDSGVFAAVAAGNDSIDSCNFSPARASKAYTVAASDRNDRLASFSNYGAGCTDIIAPGVDIPSAWIGGSTSTNTISGTSMASPHVAGVAAAVLAENPGMTPSQLASKLSSDATSGVISNTRGTPNELLYLAPSNDGGDPGDPGDPGDDDDDWDWDFGDWTPYPYPDWRG